MSSFQLSVENKNYFHIIEIVINFSKIQIYEISEIKMKKNHCED